MPRFKKLIPQIQFFPKRLTEKLNLIKAYPLTLVEAPSGFGKTTALQYFFYNVISNATPVYWYTVSTSRPLDAWKAFCENIGAFDADSGKDLFDIGIPGEDNLAFIKEIFYKIKCAEETYVVIDDFAAWELPFAGEFIMALSLHNCKNLHIVISTQLLSAKEHSIIMESGRLHILTESTLAFKREDINDYYRQAGITLNRNQLEEVSEITEGWIMALYLQLLSFIEIGKFETGDMDNLIRKALWDRLTQKERDFLLSISIFHRFSLTQATSLSGMDKEETENFLKEKRVFVHFDRESETFYLHSLFQKFLMDQFTLLPEPKQREHYLAGGDIAKEAGDRGNTLKFYYLSGKWEKLLSLPLTSYDLADIANDTTKSMILDILENTSFDIKIKYPKAIVPLAFTLFFLHENRKLMAMEDEIRQITLQSDLPHGEKNRLLGEMELLLSFLEYNKIDAMSMRHRKALALLGGPAQLINAKSTWTFGSPSILFLYYREAGKLDEELGQMDECMPVYYALTEGHGSGSEAIMRAEACFMRGDIDDGEILCHKAMHIAYNKNQNSIYQCGLFLLARIALFKNNRTMFMDSMESITSWAKHNKEDLCRYTLDLVKSYFYALTNNVSDMPLWMAEGDITDKRLVMMVQPFACLIYARHLLNKKEYLKLIGVCEYLIGISSIFPNMLSKVYANIYLAQAYNATGKKTKASDTLKEALSIALSDNILIPFAENWDGLKKLMPEDSMDKDMLCRIEELSMKLNNAISILGTNKYNLTPRENEVIELVKQGLSNKEIAAALYISLSTAKTLLGRIYEKTGVSSKTQLVQLDL